MKELVQIQKNLKVPKRQRNTFANYNYRSCEDILEAVKPLLAKYECSLIIDDKMVAVGNRIYVEATAKLMNSEKELVMTSAYAREGESKKGMDPSQLTAATSSYARKYALNGLFCIDDTRDADATNNHKDEPENPTVDNRQPIDLKKITTPEGRAFIKGFDSVDDAITRMEKTKIIDDKADAIIRDIWEEEHNDNS